MATLKDLLDNFGLESEGEEKVASEEQSDEQATLASLLEGEDYEKTASEGDEDMSLADLFLQLQEADNEMVSDDDVMDKVAEAAAEEDVSIEKVAAEYDAAGRIMARGFFDEFNKLAEGVLEGPTQAATPALGDRGTEWQMEVNKADKGPMDSTSGTDEQHKQILKGQADGPAGRAQGAMGSQFATAKHLVTARATQAGQK